MNGPESGLWKGSGWRRPGAGASEKSAAESLRITIGNELFVDENETQPAEEAAPDLASLLEQLAKYSNQYQNVEDVVTPNPPPTSAEISSGRPLEPNLHETEQDYLLYEQWREARYKHLEQQFGTSLSNHDKHFLKKAEAKTAQPPFKLADESQCHEEQRDAFPLDPGNLLRALQQMGVNLDGLAKSAAEAGQNDVVESGWGDLGRSSGLAAVGAEPSHELGIRESDSCLAQPVPPPVPGLGSTDVAPARLRDTEWEKATRLFQEKIKRKPTRRRSNAGSRSPSSSPSRTGRRKRSPSRSKHDSKKPKLREERTAAKQGKNKKSATGTQKADAVKNQNGDQTELKRKLKEEQTAVQEQIVAIKSRKLEAEKRRSLLMLELERIRKQHGELCRKMQRRKDGHRDPLLMENERLQAEIDKQFHLIRSDLEQMDNFVSNAEAGLKEITQQQKTLKISTGVGGEFEAGGKQRKAGVKGPALHVEYFDAGSHWCRNCNVICASVYDMFNHLHTTKHRNNCSSNEQEKPWIPESVGDPSKRQKPAAGAQVVVEPLKGVEFLLPAPVAFYCQLCRSFSGDPASTEDHLKSSLHADAYSKFVLENPLYERAYNLEKASSLAKRTEQEADRRENVTAETKVKPATSDGPGTKRVVSQDGSKIQIRLMADAGIITCQPPTKQKKVEKQREASLAPIQKKSSPEPPLYRRPPMQTQSLRSASQSLRSASPRLGGPRGKTFRYNHSPPARYRDENPGVQRRFSESAKRRQRWRRSGSRGSWSSSSRSRSRSRSPKRRRESHGAEKTRSKPKKPESSRKSPTSRGPTTSAPVPPPTKKAEESSKEAKGTESMSAVAVAEAVRRKFEGKASPEDLKLLARYAHANHAGLSKTEKDGAASADRKPATTAAWKPVGVVKGKSAHNSKVKSIKTASKANLKKEQESKTDWTGNNADRGDCVAVDALSMAGSGQMVPVSDEDKEKDDWHLSLQEEDGVTPSLPPLSDEQEDLAALSSLADEVVRDVQRLRQRKSTTEPAPASPRLFGSEYEELQVVEEA